jgi:hypothetical protein
MRHIKHGDQVLHVADEVAKAIDALGETLNRVGMSASITIPVIGESNAVTLKLLSVGDREIGIAPADGLTSWRVLQPRMLRARAVSSEYASRFTIGDDIS